MIKMKKKWLRGGTALALSAVMSLSMAMPVWAGSVDGVITGRSGNDPTQTVDISNNLTNTTHEAENSQTGTALNHAQTVLVSTNIPAAYTVSIPKNIVLNRQTVAAGVLSMVLPTDTFFSVTDVNIGQDQNLSISIANSNRKITLNNKKGSNSSTSKTCTASLIADGDNMRLVGDTLTTSGGKKQWTNSAKQTVRIVPDEDIYAGNWYGVLTFSVSLSEETDAGALSGSSYTYNDFSTEKN